MRGQLGGGFKPWMGHRLIFTGDFVDRGIDSKNIFDSLKQLFIEYPNGQVVALLGNHDLDLVLASQTLLLDDTGKKWSSEFKTSLKNL